MNKHAGVKVSVLSGAITYLKKLPEIHKAKTSCRKRYQDQTKAFCLKKHHFWKYVHKDKINRRDRCQMLPLKCQNIHPLSSLVTMQIEQNSQVTRLRVFYAEAEDGRLSGCCLVLCYTTALWVLLSHVLYLDYHSLKTAEKSALQRKRPGWQPPHCEW